MVSPTTPTLHPSPSNLAQAIRHLMQATLRGNRAVSVRWHGVEARLTIAMDDAYQHTMDFDIFDPDEVYPEVVSLGNELSAMFNNPLTLAQESAFDNYILDSLSRMVYGSNMIEQVGADSDITIKLSMAIFRGEDVPEETENTKRTISP